MTRRESAVKHAAHLKETRSKTANKQATGIISNQQTDKKESSQTRPVIP